MADPARARRRGPALAEIERPQAALDAGALRSYCGACAVWKASESSCALAFCFSRTASMMGRRTLLQILASLLIFCIFIALRLDLHGNALNGDESIPVLLSESMSRHGNLDANWALVDAFPEDLRYDQYNFYSYNLFCHAILVAFGPAHPLVKLRLANCALQFLAVAMIVIASRASGAGRAVQYAIAAILSVLPCMVQDAHMARPESFVYLVLAAVILAAGTLTGAKLQIAAGLAIGIGIACKVTCVCFVLILLPQMLGRLRSDRGSPITGLPVFSSALLAGFALGAPYALVHPDAYVRGLRYLHDQYSTDHPPFSEPVFFLAANARKIAAFLLMSCGPVLLLPLLDGWRSVPGWVCGLTLMSVALIGFFATEPVFFERNLSAGLVGLSVAACFTLRRWPAGAAFSASALIMAYWAVRIDIASLHPGRRLARWEAAHVGIVRPEWPFEDAAQRFDTCKGTIGIQDFGDGLSEQMLRIAEQSGAKPLGRYTSVFHGLPTSTLQPYLDADVSFFECRSR